MNDLLNSVCASVDIGAHGTLRIVDMMPRLVPEGRTADVAVVQAARVSYGAGTKSVSQDDALVDYLLRHEHWTPFEMVTFKFHIKCPLYVARQWLRHRTASVNEVSARYSVVNPEFENLAAESIRSQSAVNKQCSGDPVDADIAAEFVDDVCSITSGAYAAYLRALEAGISREQARAVLPQCTYTEFYWQTNLRNLLHFLHLRMDPHAQAEIREYACAMHAMCAPLAPVTFKSFDNHVRHAVTLSADEAAAIAAGLLALPNVGANTRLQREYAAKLGALGIVAYP